MLTDCGNVTSVENGNVNFDSGTLFGDVIRYTCNAGYNLTEGSATRECNSTGDWSGIEPKCKSGLANFECKVVISFYTHVQIQMGGAGGPDPPEKSQKYRVS